jgi:hypothetical protein
VMFSSWDVFNIVQTHCPFKNLEINHRFECEAHGQWRVRPVAVLTAKRPSVGRSLRDLRRLPRLLSRSFLSGERMPEDRHPYRFPLNEAPSVPGIERAIPSTS